MKKFLFVPLALLFLLLTQIAKADFYLDAVEVICGENNLSIEGSTLKDSAYNQILRNNEFSVIKKGIYKKNILGISIRNVTEEISKSNNLIVGKGIFVNEAFPNGAAYKAGLRNNDVILAINDKEINDVYWLIEELKEHPVGVKVLLQVLRMDDSSMQVTSFNFVPDTKEIQMEGYGNELYDIFYKIQDNANDLKKLKNILRTEKNLLINFHQEEAVCEMKLGTIKTTFNAIPTPGKGQCGAGDWGFTFSQTINENTIFDDFHMEKMNCFSILEPSIEKVDISFVSPEKIKVKLSGQWNDKGEDSSNLPLDEIFINKNFLGCDNYFVYEPKCENEFEIKELEFNLN